MFLRLVKLFFVTLLFLLASGRAQAADYPEVTFKYSQIFNSTCAEMSKQPIDAAAVTELENRLDSFREHWRKEAPQLLGTTVKLTKAPFQFRETRATLSLCFGFPSMSLPLTINMRFYLKSLRGEKATSMTIFSDTVFHELLHRYTTDRIETLPGKTTLLLTKYRDEPQLVQNHLHVLAIIKAVYGKLGREKDLDEVTTFEQTLKSAAAFKRTREIIEKEGAENFISEIRKSR
jgi:hypothetical protein